MLASLGLTQSIVLYKFQVILILLSFNFRDNIKNNIILDWKFLFISRTNKTDQVILVTDK